MGELLEPFKLLARVCTLRYGPLIVTSAIALVILLVIAKVFLDTQWPELLFTILASFTGALWFSVIIFGVASIAYATTLRRKIAVAIQQGEHIRARLTYHEETA